MTPSTLMRASVHTCLGIGTEGFGILHCCGVLPPQGRTTEMEPDVAKRVERRGERDAGPGK